MGDEVGDLQKRLREMEDEADDQRARGQAQRIQLLDEVCPLGPGDWSRSDTDAMIQLNSLQAEVGELRKQLRVANAKK